MDIIYNTNPIDYLNNNNYLVLDFETTNLDKGDPLNPDNKIVLAVWKYNNKLNHLVTNEYNLEPLLTNIEQADFVVAHNAKFELGWLKRAGVKLEHVFVFCTQIAEYTIRSNRNYPISLEASLQRRGLGGKESLVSKLIHGGVCPSEIPANWLLQYCKEDVLQCEKLFLAQLEELQELNLLKVAYTRNLVCPALTDIEFKGMCLDKEYVENIYLRLKKEAIETEIELDEITGGINPRSPKQVAEFVFDTLKFPEPKERNGKPKRTKAGGRPCGTSVIANLSPRNKRQRRFLTVKAKQAKLNAALTKTVEKFHDCCEENEQAIIYANLNQTVTHTGRLSSTGRKHKVQLQNIDRNYKPLIKARKKGWLVGEADEAQLEFRVAGELTNDIQIFKDVQNKVDVHTTTAKTLTDAGQPTIRQEAKSRTFKPLYGGTSGTKAEKAYFKVFKDRYATLSSTQEDWVYDALSAGYTVVPQTGQRFYWPKLVLTESGYIEGNTSVRNYPIQYFATGEIVLIALLYLWHYSKQEKTQFFLTNTVHDSLVAELPQEERELFDKVSVYALTEFPREYIERVYGYQLSMIYEAEVVIADHWKITEEWKERNLVW